MAYINIDIDLDDFDLDDILTELEHRYTRSGIRANRDRKIIDDFVKKMKMDFDDAIELHKLSLIDKIKVDFVLKNLSLITIEDLERLTNKNN